MVGSDVVFGCPIKFRFEGRIGYLFAVNVHRQKVDIHVLEIEGVPIVPTVERFVAHTSHHDAVRQLPQKHVVLGKGQITDTIFHRLRLMGYFAVPFSRAFMCPNMTAGLTLTFLMNTDAFRMMTL